MLYIIYSGIFDYYYAYMTHSVFLLSFSVFGLFGLGLFRFVVWRFHVGIGRVRKQLFRKSVILPMPLAGTPDGEPGVVYAQVKKEFEAANEKGCELPLIYLISHEHYFDFSDLFELLARTYLEKDQVIKAEMTLREGIARGTHSDATYALLARILVRQKKKLDAFELLKQASYDLASCDAIWEDYFLLAKKIGDLSESKRALRELQVLSPNESWIQTELKKLS